MPVVGSGVILVEYSVPKGSTNARPPAYGAPPSAVWHASQSAARVRYSPRSMRLADLSSAGTPVGSPPVYAVNVTVLPPANAVGEGPSSS